MPLRVPPLAAMKCTVKMLYVQGVKKNKACVWPLGLWWLIHIHVVSDTLTSAHNSSLKIGLLSSPCYYGLLKNNNNNNFVNLLCETHVATLNTLLNISMQFYKPVN